MKRLLILGAGGHGRVIADIAKLTNKYESVFYFDDADLPRSSSFYVIGKLKEIDNWLVESEVIVAVGDNKKREELMSCLKEKGARFAVLCHPSAVIAHGVEIGTGSVVMANAVINCGSKIGEGVIVNTAATVDHDSVIESYVHISPGAHLAGMVHIDKGTWIGIGASVINNIDICAYCTVGAGGVVIENIYTPGVYVGIPARMILATSAKEENV